MDEDNNYILSELPLLQEKYTAINQRFNIDSNLFQNWIQDLSKNYELNDATLKIQSKAYENQSHFDVFAQTVYSFIRSQLMINRNHQQYLQNAHQKFINPKASSYTDSAIKVAEKIRTKKVELKNCKKKIQKLEQKVLMQEDENKFNAEPEQFFRTHLWNERKLTLKNYLELMEKNNEKFEQDSQETIKLSHQFQEFLFSYRKKLLKYKVEYIKQSAKVSRSFFQCISELITLGFNQLNTIVYKLKNQNIRASNSIRSSYRSSRIENQIDSIAQQTKLMGLYKKILYPLKFMFSQETQFAKNKRYPIKKDQKERQNEALKSFFQGNYHLYEQILRATQISQLFRQLKQNIITEIDRTIFRINKKQEENIRKLDILSTLDGDKVKKSKKIIRDSKVFDRDSNFFEEIISDFDVEACVNQLLETILIEYSALSKNCFKLFENSTYKKPHHQSLMEITNQFKEILINQIKPPHEELWLWKDWRDFNFIESVAIETKFQFEEIKNKYERITAIIGQQNADTKYECSISLEKKHKVVVILQSRALQLFGNKKYIDFIIPRENITYIEKINEKIIIKTNNGAKFRLGLVKEISLEELEAKLKEQYLGSGLQKNIPKKERVKLTEEELRVLEERRKTIEKDLPNPEQYILYASKEIETDLQTLYEVILTDSGQFLPSRSDSSFFEYVNVKKFKNYNYKTSKYDKPGPAYYTGDQNSGVTFVNCPPFSTRNSEMDHPLPPIPFIPKQCHCLNVERIYWISHEEIFYLNEVRQTSPPMMASFVVYQLTVAKKVDENKIKIEILGKIDFLKQARMKSVLKSGGEGEMKDLLPKILNEMEAAIKSYNRIMAKSAGGQVAESEGNDEQMEKEEKRGASGGYNKNHIIIFAIATIIMNLLLHYLWS